MSLKSDEPNWSSYQALHITGQAEILPDGDIAMVTTGGLLRISPLQDGMRWRIGPQTLPVYPILIANPVLHEAALSQDFSHPSETELAQQLS